MQLGCGMCFGNSGAIAAIRSERGVHLVDLAGTRAPSLFEIENVVDLAAVGTELWAAGGVSPRLYRFGADCRLREERELWGRAGRLRPTVVGDAGALWSEEPATVIRADGKTCTFAHAGQTDCILPVSHSRWIVCRRDRIQLRDPGTERWSVAIPTGGGRVLDGSVLFGGRTVALIVEGPQGQRQMLILGLHDGAVHHRLTLSGIDLVRFAPARGLALMRSSDSSLVLLDLRFGQVLKERREDRGFVDAAIDPGGHTFMLRFSESHDDIVIGDVRELLADPSPSTVVLEAPPPIASPPPPPVQVTESAVPFHRGTRTLPVAQLLAPRQQVSGVSPDAAVALLEGYNELVAAMTGAAIARAWDVGRLSAPVEGGLPFHAEVSGLRGRAAGKAVEDVAEAAREVEDAYAAVRAREAALGTNKPPLAALATEFELSQVAQLVLLVVAAPSLWGELARLYGILTNDVARPLVDELLVTTILEPHANRHAIAAELDRDGPLIKHGLIRAGAGKMRPFVSLACDPIVLRLLRGADCEVELTDMRIMKTARPFDELMIPAAVKDDIAARIAQAPPSKRGRIVVRGRSGAGRAAVLSAIAASAGRSLALIDTSMIVRDLRRRSDELVRALRRANLVGLLPCVDGLENLPSDDPSARDLVRQILDEHPGPLAVRLPQDSEPPLSPGYLSIELPPLTMEQRTTTWKLLLAEYGLEVRDVDDLADRFRVGPAVIARACQQIAARQEPNASGERADAALALETTIRQHLELKLRATANRVERLTSWSRVILPPDIQESVLELIARIKHRRTVYDTWGMGEVLTSSRGVTALFQGGPGTGKTLVASAIANELGMDLYRVDLSRIMSKWIGETEQNLAKLFDAAEDGHAIVLFDEADSLFAKRTEVKSSVDRYANLEVNYLLQRLDTFEGIAILTTNFGTSIDNAFKRRLSFRLTFPFPDEEAREQLWRTHLPANLPKSGTFDLAALARKYRLSGGYIRNAALRAAFLAAEEQSPLTQDHLHRAIKAEFREIGKIAESGVLE